MELMIEENFVDVVVEVVVVAKVEMINIEFSFS